MKGFSKARLPGFIVATLVLLLAIILLLTAHGYSGGSGLFPRFIGWIFLLLSAVEVFIQMNTLFKPPVTTSSHAQVGIEKVFKEIKAIMWLGFLLFLIYLVGFGIAVPVFIFVFLRISAQYPWRHSFLFSLGVAGFAYLLFVYLLEYRLPPGLLFGI